MKDYLTMKEAGVLLGKTTKTIKNYIKRGVIKNYFLVDGKYGQEYKISVRDLEPLGIIRLDVLMDGFGRDEKKGQDQGKNSQDSSGNESESHVLPGEGNGQSIDSGAFVSRFEEMAIELEKARAGIASLAGENGRLKQELEEKNMLIQVLMKKKE